MYSLAAAYNNPATRTTTAHKLFPTQLTTLPVAERSHDTIDTIDPITPGKAAAALPARFASNLARLCSCFLTHSFAPSCDGGFDGVAAPPLVRITASTITPIIIPMAVKTLTMVMPCSLNNEHGISRYWRIKLFLCNRVGADNATTDAEDEAIAKAYSNRFCIPLDFELLVTHMPFYQAGLGDRLEYELTFNDYDKVINSSDADSSYTIKNICLEFEKVTDIELARQIRQQHNGRIASLYDRILRHRKITKNKSDKLWNINLNVPARSMKDILMLFEDPNRTSTEDYYNPKSQK